MRVLAREEFVHEGEIQDSYFKVQICEGLHAWISSLRRSDDFRCQREKFVRTVEAI